MIQLGSRLRINIQEYEIVIAEDRVTYPRMQATITDKIALIFGRGVFRPMERISIPITDIITQGLKDETTRILHKE